MTLEQFYPIFFHDLNKIPFFKSLNSISNQTTVKMLRADAEWVILALDLHINILKKLG